MDSKKKYLFDTSAILFSRIEAFIAENIEKISEIIIPEYVLSEMENQANTGRAIGIEGLERLKKIRTFANSKKIDIKIIGRRPTLEEIQLSKKGRIDALIKDLAKKEKAVLITCDFVQYKSAEALGIKCIHIDQRKEKLFFEGYIDSTTMAIHLKEGQNPIIKRGTIKNPKLYVDSNTKLTKTKIEEIKKEIITAIRNDESAFFLINQNNVIVVKYKNMRISMFSRPFSKEEEITVVMHAKQPTLRQYHIEKEILENIEDEDTSILICGKKQSGKTTFAQAIALHFNEKKKIVRTIEKLRDMNLPDEISQYSFFKGNAESSAEFTLLSNSDIAIIDSVANKDDFNAYMRLTDSGIKAVCVLDAKNIKEAMDKLSEFIEPKRISSVVKIIVYMNEGEVDRIFNVHFVAEKNILELEEV